MRDKEMNTKDPNGAVMCVRRRFRNRVGDESPLRFNPDTQCSNFFKHFINKFKFELYKVQFKTQELKDEIPRRTLKCMLLKIPRINHSF